MTNPFGGHPGGESTRDDFVASFKPHTGYDAPLLVIKAESAAALHDKIASAEATGLFAAIASADSAFKAAYNLGVTFGATPVQHPSTVQAVAPTSVPPATAPAGPAPQGPPGTGPAPSCPHGVKVFKSGQGKRGPWQAWMCPAPKGTPGQCPPEWIN